MANADGINYVSLAGGAADISFSNASAGFTLKQTATSTGNEAITYLSDTTADTLNLIYSGAAGYTVSSGGTGLTASLIETLNISTVDSNTTTNGITTSAAGTDTTTTAVYTTTIVDTSAKSVVISGAVGVALTLASTALTSFDASGVTGTGLAGAVTYTTSALAAAATLKGGAGTNTINASASTKSVTITGGAGLDYLTGGTAADSISGGNGGGELVGGYGNDTIIGGTGTDIITGGFGADVLTGGGGNDTYLLINGNHTGLLPTSAGVSYNAAVGYATFSTVSMDKITDFSSGDTIVTGAGVSGTAVTNANGYGSDWTNTQGFVRGTYDSTNGTFTFGSAGTSSLYIFDADGLTTTASDLYAVVLVDYVDSALNDTFGGTATSGLIGVA